MFDSIESAMQALQHAEMDVAADFGEEMVESAYSDIVHSIAGMCPPDVARELLRRTIGEENPRGLERLS
jgi:hypothetical protein